MCCKRSLSSPVLDVLAACRYIASLLGRQLPQSKVTRDLAFLDAAVPHTAHGPWLKPAKLLPDAASMSASPNFTSPILLRLRPVHGHNVHLNRKKRLSGAGCCEPRTNDQWQALVEDVRSSQTRHTLRPHCLTS